MTRLNLVLLLAVLASALYLVRTQYDSRRLFVELERAKTEAHRLDVEHDGLQVQQRAQATPLRVEKLAKEKLVMRTATPAITQYVTYKEPAVKTASQAAPDTPRSRARLDASPGSGSGSASVGVISR